MAESNSAHSALARYGVACLCVLSALLARWLMSGLLRDNAPFMFFILGAIVAALYGGWQPGLVAAVLGEMVGDYFFVQPTHTFGPRTYVEWAFCLTFISETGIMIAIVEALRRSRFQARRSLILAKNRGDQLRNTLQNMGEAEARIRELAAVVNSAQDAIISTDMQGAVKSWNGGAERLFGFTAEEMRGQSLTRIVPDHRREELSKLSAALAAGTRVEAFETVRLRKDGRELPVSVSLSPVHDNSGEVVGASSITRDISEMKRANAAEEALVKKFEELRAAQEALQAQTRELAASRQALEAERSRYRELFDSAPVGYVITNPAGVIQQVNTQAAVMLKHTAAVLHGRSLAEWLPVEARPEFAARMERLLSHDSRAVENWETTIEPAGAPAFECSMLANRLEDSELGLAGLRWILRDITERKLVEQKILRMNSELEQRVRERTAALEAANREMEAFSYSVSHDLRAPLRSVVGFSKALMQDYADKLDEEGRMYLQCSQEAGLRMNRLIEDLLSLSRAARAELNQTDVDLSALANSIVAEFRERDPGREVELNIAPGLVACGDAGLLRIALENLLGNAWKFTSRKPQARIEVGSCVRDGESIFFVRDNGAGFNMARATRLFGVFQRLHLQDEFPGTGIGLATVRRILNRHGGEVWAESAVGEGATFYFKLPKTVPAPLAMEEQAA